MPIFVLSCIILSVALWEISKLSNIMDASDIPDYGKISLQRVQYLESKFSEVGYGSTSSLGTMTVNSSTNEEKTEFFDNSFPSSELSFPPFTFGLSIKDKVVYAVDHGKYFRAPLAKIKTLCSLSLVFFVFSLILTWLKKLIMPLRQEQ